MMKKVLFWMLFIGVILNFTACNDDDDVNAGIVSSWKAYEYYATSKYAADAKAYVDNGTTIVFNSDGTFSGKMFDSISQNTSGTYKFTKANPSDDKNLLVLSWGNIESSLYYVNNGHTMTLSYNGWASDGVAQNWQITFERQ